MKKKRTLVDWRTMKTESEDMKNWTTKRPEKPLILKAIQTASNKWRTMMKASVVEKPENWPIVGCLINGSKSEEESPSSMTIYRTKPNIEMIVVRTWNQLKVLWKPDNMTSDSGNSLWRWYVILQILVKVTNETWWKMGGLRLLHLDAFYILPRLVALFIVAFRGHLNLMVASFHLCVCARTRLHVAHLCSSEEIEYWTSINEGRKYMIQFRQWFVMKIWTNVRKSETVNALDKDHNNNEY